MAFRSVSLILVGFSLALVSSVEMEVCSSRAECERRGHIKKDAFEALPLDEIDQRDLLQAKPLGSLKDLPAKTSPITRYRTRTFLEMQPYLIAYGSVIGCVSPLASCYQLVKLNPHVQVPFKQMLRLSFAILPQQAALKDAQMTIATPIKKYCNPWAAFALIGVLQGGLYGHSNVHFANSLGIGSRPSLSSVFRGVGFAGSRDLISQGFPFVLAPVLKEKVFDTLLPSKSPTSWLSGLKRWVSVFSMSVFGTYLSQGLHNSQITMQANPHLGYVGALKQVFAVNGLAALWKGAEARVGLLLIVAFLNEGLLKKAWQPVEVSQPKAKRTKPAKKPLVSKPTPAAGRVKGVRRGSIGAATGPATVPQAA